MLGEGVISLIRMVWVGLTGPGFFVLFLFLTLDFNLIIPFSPLLIIPFNVVLYTEPCLSSLISVITNSINFLRKITVLSFPLGLLFVLFSLKPMKPPSLTLPLWQWGQMLSETVSPWPCDTPAGCEWPWWVLPLDQSIKAPRILCILSLLGLPAGCKSPSLGVGGPKSWGMRVTG